MQRETRQGSCLRTAHSSGRNQKITELWSNRLQVTFDSSWILRIRRPKDDFDFECQDLLSAPESGLLNCLVKGEGRFADLLWGKWWGMVVKLWAKKEVSDKSGVWY